MTRRFQLATGYGRALALNGQAFAAEHYEAAYHFLLAALHCAEDMGDARRLRDIAALARRQWNALDLRSPHHRLATKSAHGGRNVFDIAADMAESVIHRFDIEHRMAEHRRANEAAQLAALPLPDGEPCHAP